jgi:hypothetical protein
MNIRDVITVFRSDSASISSPNSCHTIQDREPHTHCFALTRGSSDLVRTCEKNELETRKNERHRSSLDRLLRVYLNSSMSRKSEHHEHIYHVLRSTRLAPLYSDGRPFILSPFRPPFSPLDSTTDHPIPSHATKKSFGSSRFEIETACRIRHTGGRMGRWNESGRIFQFT